MVGDVSKLIFFLLLGFVAYWLLRRKRIARGPDAKRQPHSPETMVSCAYCGLHVPQGECVTVAGRYYCGEEHRRLDAGNPRG